MAISSAVSFGAVVSWCLIKIIDKELTPEFEEEQAVKKSNTSSLIRGATKVSIFAIGLLSEAPLAYMAYVYNNKNVLYPIGALIIDSSLPIYSLSLSAEQLLKHRKLHGIERKLELLKQKLCQALLDISDETNLSLWRDRINAINALQNEDQDKVSRLMVKLFEKIPQEKPRERSSTVKGRWVVQGVGIVLSFSQLFLSAGLGFRGMQLFTDKPSLWYTGGTVVLLSNVYLNMAMTIDGSVGAYNAIIALCKGDGKKTRQSQYHPSLQKVLYILSYIACILSFAGPVKVSQDYFEGPLSLYMQMTTALGTIIFSSVACMDFVNELIEVKMAKMGADDVKQLMKVVYELRQIIDLINQSPLLELAKFTRIIPHEALSKWLDELKITAAQIDEYIQMQTAPLLREGEKTSLLSPGQ